MLSGSSETIIFMFLGVATIHDDHVWNWPYVCLTILFCTVYRTIGKGHRHLRNIDCLTAVAIKERREAYYKWR
jgi:hypothetical protein